MDRDTERPGRLDQQAARHRRPACGQEGRVLHRTHPGLLPDRCKHYAALMSSFKASCVSSEELSKRKSEKKLMPVRLSAPCPVSSLLHDASLAYQMPHLPTYDATNAA